ncbi:hypothetical protein AVEN_91181-1 [Araneus ventricosus]|uniref:SOCS box domain-containing protein n=1 Tax=Araneus ventricosus TaxID=182803 RepID=A0A4Y2TNX7_ARAVE|nr:hypothetical protein AVEN_91181-1 [Araneus ventricosus]
MAIKRIESLFKSIELSDAKSIVTHSSDVHDSITYLDLSTGEFSSFRSEIATSNPVSPRTCTAYSKSFEFSTENLAQYSRKVIPSLLLDLPCRSFHRAMGKTGVRYLYPFPLERGDGFYVAEIYVSKSWYLRTFQSFIIRFVKSAKQKLTSLGKFHHFRGTSFQCDDFIKICYCMSILCIECYDSDRVKGVLIALDFPGFEAETDSAEIREYFLYHNCISSGNRFPETTDLGEDIIGLVLLARFFRFIPHLLKFGFYTISGERDLDGYDERLRISSRRKRLMLETLRLQEIHPINLYQVDETFDPYMPQLAHKALAEMWRSIPDALLSQKEMEFTISKYPELSIEELQSTYERIVGPYPSEPTPRSLTHYCRIAIRKVMSFNLQLPHGISKLDLPATVLSFLRLEY